MKSYLGRADLCRRAGMRRHRSLLRFSKLIQARSAPFQALIVWEWSLVPIRREADAYVVSRLSTPDRYCKPMLRNSALSWHSILLVCFDQNRAEGRDITVDLRTIHRQVVTSRRSKAAISVDGGVLNRHAARCRKTRSCCTRGKLGHS